MSICYDSARRVMEDGKTRMERFRLCCGENVIEGGKLIWSRHRGMWSSHQARKFLELRQTTKRGWLGGEDSADKKRKAPSWYQTKAHAEAAKERKISRKALARSSMRKKFKVLGVLAAICGGTACQHQLLADAPLCQKASNDRPPRTPFLAELEFMDNSRRSGTINCFLSSLRCLLFGVSIKISLWQMLATVFLLEKEMLCVSSNL